MNYKQLVKLIPQKKSLQKEERKLRRMVEKLTKQLDNLHEQCLQLERVSYVDRGMPITEYTPNDTTKEYSAIGDDIHRWATAYLNQHNKETWGVQVHGDETTVGGVFLGKDFSKQTAINIAKDWAATGQIPAKE